MKKVFLYAIMSAASVMVACNKVEPIPAQEEVGPEAEVEMITETITGSRDASTKVTIDNTSGAFAWTMTKDQVAVHVSNGTYVTSAGASASKKSATFDVTYPTGSTRDAFAVFPSSIVTATVTNYGQSGQPLDVTLPASYTLAQVTGETSPCPMIATNDPGSSDWSFKQLCGLLRLTVNGIPPSTKRLEIDFDGKKVCGDFSIASPVTPGTSVIETAADDSHDTIKITKDGTDVTLNNGVRLDGLVVNIPLPTGEYTDITVTAYDALTGGNAIQTTPCTFAYTATSARAKKLTASMGYDLSAAPFADSTYPYAYIYQSNPAATSNTITIAKGQKILLDGVNMLVSGNAINCAGNAEIVLSGTNTIHSQALNSGDNNKAIIKAGPVDKTLTISGNGTLEVRTRYTGTWMGAFIGSDKNSVCGNITITGGTITAIAYPKPGATEYNNSASNGAVIGAGCANNGTSSCGNILITGGTVTVDTHAGGGAGIGSGTSENSSGISTCGTITINGGSVNSKANQGGAGIGSGRVGIVRNNVTYNGYSRCEGIIIEGTASVTASSSSGSGQNDYAGAAIGTGNSGQVGYITIRGGTVTATQTFNAPGIGAGRFKSNCGDISISGGTVTAQGGFEAAGIGTGNGYNLRVSTCGKITITAGVTKVTAYKGASGYKSIGQGKAAYTSCGTVTIGESTGQQEASPYIYPAP